MPLNVSADLLQDLKELIGRTGAGTTDVIQDTDYYTRLTKAQTQVFSEVLPMFPEAFYQKVGTTSLPQLTSVDGNVWTFGNDNTGNPIMPIDDAQIYREPEDVPDNALVKDYDYIGEATQIRLLRNRKFGGTLFWRGAVEPGPISATAGQVPCFLPAGANELTSLRAARNFTRLRNPALSAALQETYAERRPYWALIWKEQFGSGGAYTVSLLDFVTLPGPKI